MPMRAPSIRSCGCVLSTGERCRHMIAHDRERKARFDKHRPSARERGYNKKWEEARETFLAIYPTCCRCSAPATVVDHIIPHKGSPKLFWDRKNWQPLCAFHHNSVKQREERR